MGGMKNLTQSAGKAADAGKDLLGKALTTAIAFAIAFAVYYFRNDQVIGMIESIYAKPLVLFGVILAYAGMSYVIIVGGTIIGKLVSLITIASGIGASMIHVKEDVASRVSLAHQAYVPDDPHTLLLIIVTMGMIILFVRTLQTLHDR